MQEANNDNILEVDNISYSVREKNIIEDISFLVFGCTAAISTSSMITEMAKGKTIEEAEAITEKQLIDALDGLPQSKLHCSVLGVKGLRAAIDDYKNK